MAEQQEGNVPLQAGVEMAQAALGMQPIKMSGVVNGILWLTPSDVKRANEIRKGPHWSFVLEPMKNAKMLAPHNHGVYMGGEQFPPGCCECQDPATHVELVEAGMAVQNISSKLRVSTKADPQRVFQALRDKRAWYAVPFCAKHSLTSKCLSFTDSSNQQNKVWKVTLKIAHPDWGRSFGELNDLEGVWIYPTFLGDVKMHDPRDVEALPSGWFWKVALLRLPFYVLTAAAFFVVIWTFLQVMDQSGGNVELCSVEMIPAIVAFVLMVAFMLIAPGLGHFPKPKDE